jgi:hypothetical protein
MVLKLGLLWLLKVATIPGKSTTNDTMTNDQALQTKRGKDKILSNAQGLSEEILEIRYLIEYMTQQ